MTVTKENQLRAIYTYVVESNIAKKLSFYSAEPKESTFGVEEMKENSTSLFAVTESEVKEFSTQKEMQMFCKSSKGLVITWNGEKVLFTAWINGVRP